MEKDPDYLPNFPGRQNFKESNEQISNSEEGEKGAMEDKSTEKGLQYYGTWTPPPQGSRWAVSP